jgi:intracellular multiplication protein IcmD
MTTLFEAAASNPTLIMEIVDAMRNAASGVGVTLSDDPLGFVQLASQNAAFKSTLQSQLSRIAATHGLAFEPEVSVSVPGAAGQLGAIEKSHKGDSTQTPIAMPIALLFIAAVLVFAPSTFKSVGGTMFGDLGQIDGVDGFESFGR